VVTPTGPIGTGDVPDYSYPPLDGRDISRIRTELRLAQLALIGLITEEQDSPPGQGTHSRVLLLLQRGEQSASDAIEVLGEALAALVEEHGKDPG
jgi:hypothetical protein